MFRFRALFIVSVTSDRFFQKFTPLPPTYTLDSALSTRRFNPHAPTLSRVIPLNTPSLIDHLEAVLTLIVLNETNFGNLLIYENNAYFKPTHGYGGLN